MLVVCPVCGESFKRSGIRRHQDSHGNIPSSANETLQTEPSQEPRELPDTSHTITSVTAQILTHDEPFPMEVDPHGDFFGDYEDYLQEELEETSADEMTMDEHDSEDDEDDILIQPGIGLEAPRGERNPSAEAEVKDDETGPSLRLRGGAEEELKKKPFVVGYGGRLAGKVYSQRKQNLNGEYGITVGGGDNPYSPFASKLDWEFAHWAKTRGPSSTAFTELMAIEGVVEKLGLTFKNSAQLNKIVDSLPGRPRFERHEIIAGDEVCEVYMRDIIACIRALWGDPDFSAYLIILPEKHYTNGSKTVRMFHDMQTGRWWWSTQDAVERDCPGATIIPIIISTDKTQLTVFRNKNAYPVYMTIGNIPKEIRRKPSKRAYVLLAYLPTTKLETVQNHASRRRIVANLYHACMAKILEPLKEAGRNGVYMASGDGHIRRLHPIYACFSGDYPEQVLTTCTKTGECPACPCPKEALGAYGQDDGTPTLRDLSSILEVLDSFDDSPGDYLQTCAGVGIKPVHDPFWKDLPYVNIYRSIAPDILHQLYQGIVKHVVSWITEACGAAEIDARCRRLPPNHNIRQFLKGITSLSRVTGQEHDQMCRILLGLIIDIPLPNGLSNIRLIRAVRALLDFVFLAQYPVHTDETLELLENALESFHANKDIFIDLGLRENFNIPKLHFAKHYVEFIKLFGTLDNFNTEYTERLHIDLAKDAYDATNHKDEFSQMTLWLERKEKVYRHQQYIRWKLDGCPASPQVDWSPPGLELDRRLRLTKHPTIRGVHLNILERDYSANHFREALARFVTLLNHPNITRNELERRLWHVRIPFRKVPVWHRIKYQRSDPATSQLVTADSIHCKPAKMNKRGEVDAARFDTVLVQESPDDDEEEFSIGRVRVVFSLPESSFPILFKEGVKIPGHLAYIHWYTALPAHTDPNHGFHKIKPLKEADGSLVCSIIPVANIVRSAHLFPQFGRFAPPEWTSSNVLDLCSSFFVNSFTDKHFYRILY